MLVKRVHALTTLHNLESIKY